MKSSQCDDCAAFYIHCSHLYAKRVAYSHSPCCSTIYFTHLNDPTPLYEIFRSHSIKNELKKFVDLNSSGNSI